LPAVLGRLDPAEILVAGGVDLGDWGSKRGPEQAVPSAAVARRKLAEAFGVADVEAFGSFSDAEAGAALLALEYVRATQAGTMPRLAPPAPLGVSGRLAMAGRGIRCSPRCGGRRRRRGRGCWPNGSRRR
jgi:DNA mismatch repair protein MutS